MAGLYRQVFSEFWSDPSIVDSFTPEDRLFYLYLMTNEHTQQCGIYEVSVKQIAFEVGYSVETVRTLLDRFQNVHHRIRYNPATRELAVLNWAKYNYPVKTSDNQLPCIRLQLQAVKEKSLIREVVEKADPEVVRALMPYIPQDGSPLQAPPEGLRQGEEEREGEREGEGRAREAEEGASQGEHPDAQPPAVQLLGRWYKTHQKKTGLLIYPSDDDRRLAVESLGRLGGDLDAALRAEAWFWDHWQEMWWACRKGKRGPGGAPLPDWSFQSFARHIASCIPIEAVPQEAQKEAEHVGRF